MRPRLFWEFARTVSLYHLAAFLVAGTLILLLSDFTLLWLADVFGIVLLINLAAVLVYYRWSTREYVGFIGPIGPPEVGLPPPPSGESSRKPPDSQE